MEALVKKIFKYKIGNITNDFHVFNGTLTQMKAFIAGTINQLTTTSI
ncbi:MAG: hypothetical protein ACI865_000993 [Flavobacteriaceae bacterium]|jgi:hypothetical protein